MRVDDIKERTDLSNYFSIVSDDNYKKLVENCFLVLHKKPVAYPMSTLYESKGDVVKKVYSTLLKISAELARKSGEEQDVIESLKIYGVPQNRIDIYWQLYQKSRLTLIGPLLNIGRYLPHVTDLSWKVNFVVKSSMVDEPTGPLFRISLITEQYDVKQGKKAVRDVSFTCTTEELEDLVYKLKDMVRHCNTLANGIL